MSYEAIEFEINDGIGLLTISRPKSLNALNSQVLTEINEALNELDRNDSVRALIVTGNGEKAFVAGADINELADLSPESARSFAEKGQKTFRRLEVLRCPVIAAVNGFALGGGLELALSCDYIIASDNARFGLPEVSLGLMPGFGGTQRLSRWVGLPHARRMTYLGKAFEADEALQIGLVSLVVPQSELLQTAKGEARKIATHGPVAVGRAKESINRGWDMELDESLQLERDLFGELFRTTDQKEGTTAFLEKRRPEFKGE